MDEWTEVKATEGKAWDFSANPVLIGTLVGFRKDVGPNKSVMYQIKQVDGITVDMWGSTSIDMSFRNLQIGQKVKIEFLGMKTNPRTKREFKAFKVYSQPMEVSEEEIPFDDINI